MRAFSLPFFLSLLTSRSLESIFGLLEVDRHLCSDESPLDHDLAIYSTLNNVPITQRVRIG